MLTKHPRELDRDESRFKKQLIFERYEVRLAGI